MAIYTIKKLKISTENERAFMNAFLVVQSHIENEKAWDCKYIFDKNPQLLVVEMEFDASSSPPIEAMTQLNAMESISFEATLVNELDQNDPRYRFTGGGRNLIAAETDLNDRKSDYQDFQKHLKLRMSDLLKQRGNLDLAINALRSLAAPASKGAPLF